jgi:hypothetical protein
MARSTSATGFILRPPDFECIDPKAKLAGDCLNLTHLQRGGGITDIGHDSHSPESGVSLAQEFEALANQIRELD